MSFERPTGHYDERIYPMDEQLCELIKQRKEISNNNPGFLPLEYITGLAKKFDLYKNLLNVSNNSTAEFERIQLDILSMPDTF